MTKAQAEQIYFHPQDFIQIYQTSQVKSEDIVEHLSYKVNYFIEAKRDKEGTIEFSKEKQPVKINSASTQLIEQVLEYRLRQLAYMTQEQIIRIYEGQLTSYLVHGLGSGHVTETAMSIHPVYGVPYLPASSIKGVVRHWFLHTFFNGCEKLVKEKAKRSEEEKLFAIYEDVFGTQEQSGKVSFFDVYVTSGTLTSDVMTVHFPEYYGSKGAKPATDYYDKIRKEGNSPIPIPFYVVNTDTHLEFPFIVKTGGKTNSRFTPEELAIIVSDWLTTALSEMGIGSKTASGYGRFSNWKNVTEDKIVTLQQTIKREQEERIKVEQVKAEAEKQAALLETMTEDQQLAYFISRLDTQNEQERQKSKTEYFDTVIETGNIQAAEALKAYWQQTKDWKDNVSVKTKKKQEQKILQLNQLLNK